MRSSKWPWFAALANLVIDLLLIVGLIALAATDLHAYRVRTRGIESGLAENMPPLSVPRLGVNVALERYRSERALRRALDEIRALGVGTVRQRFSWAELEPAPRVYRWEDWDRILPQVQARGLRIIAVLDTSPPWARPAWEAENIWAPPTSPEDYARFVEEFARRYGQYVSAYQIWDQPNIAPHWGRGEIDPGGYVALLRLASEAIRRANAGARIIAAGLAPNTESGGRNMSDLLFLHEIYRRGAGPYLYILGIKAYGFWSGPDDRRVDAEVLNFSRVILLREEMRRRGEGHKPIWAVEGGWCALPAGWTGHPSPQGSDRPFVQAERLARALERVQQEWPWMGLICPAHYQPLASPDDPIWGYALHDPDDKPTLLEARLRAHSGDGTTLYPGRTTEWLPLAQRDAGMGRLRLAFWGTDLALEVAKGPEAKPLRVTLMGLKRDLLLDLYADTPTMERISLGHWRTADVRHVWLGPDAASLEALRGVAVGYRPLDTRLWLGIAVACLVSLWLAREIWRTAGAIPWRRAWQRVRAPWARLPSGLGWLILLLPFGLLLLAPPGLRLVGFLAYGVVALCQPERALFIAVASIPFAPFRTILGPGIFAVTEVSVLVAVGARLWNALLGPAVARQPGAGMRPSSRSTTAKRWIALDGVVLLLVLLGFGTSFLAEYRRVAFREWRVVVLESALLYGLIRSTPCDGAHLRRMMDVFWFAGVSVAAIGLIAYWGFDVAIEAEGVRRAQAMYGSPNNLALYMERILPLGLAVAFWGHARWRRWSYALGSLAVAAALFFTYSRGSWFLAVPAAFMALILLRGARLRWLLLGLLLIALLTLLPLIGTERLRTLLDTERGTTFLRLSLWRAAIQMLRDHPWWGIGLDNFLYYYGDYIQPGAEIDRWLSHPHNLVLDFWLRLGIGGVVLLMALLGGFFRRAGRAYRSYYVEGDMRAMLLGLIAGMVALIAHGLVDSSYFVIELAHWFLFALGWAAQADLAWRHEGGAPGPARHGDRPLPSAKVGFLGDDRP